MNNNYQEMDITHNQWEGEEVEQLHKPTIMILIWSITVHVYVEKTVIVYDKHKDCCILLEELFVALNDIGW